MMLPKFATRSEGAVPRNNHQACRARNADCRSEIVAGLRPYRDAAAADSVGRSGP